MATTATTAEKAQQQQQQPVQNQTPFQLIGQGGFGCVYYRGFDPTGDKTSPLYVSKLVLNRSENKDEAERVIGKMVSSRMPGYDAFFNVVIDSQPIDLAVLSPEMLDKCDVVKRHAQNNTATQSQSEFKVLKQLYVPSVTLLDFVTRRGIYMDASQLHNLPKENVKKIGAVRYSVPQFMNVLISSYEYLLVGVARMQNELELVHYDLKVQNVVLNAYTKKPIIIDFGLTFSIRDVRAVLDKGTNGKGVSDLDTVLSLKSFFYGFHPDYSPWALETHMISYIVQTTAKAVSEASANTNTNTDTNTNTATATVEVATITKDALVDMVEKYIDSNNEYLRGQPEKVKRAFFDRTMRTYSTRVVGKPGLQVIRQLLDGDDGNNGGWKKWDLYSVATLCLDIIQEAYKSYPTNEMDPYRTEIERFRTALAVTAGYISE
jgi:serine/threonine protein kinase